MKETTLKSIDAYREFLAGLANMFRSEDGLFTDISAIREALTSVVLSERLGKTTPIGEVLDSHPTNQLTCMFDLLLKAKAHTDEKYEAMVRDKVHHILKAFVKVQNNGQK